MPPSETFTRRTATVGARTVDYRDAGQGERAVVVLHADGDDATVAYAGLAPGRRVLLLDVRDADEHPDRTAALVHDLLDGLGLRVGGVLGVGPGVPGALRLVERVPEVPTLVLVAPTARADGVAPAVRHPSGDAVPTLVVYGDDDARLAGPPPHPQVPNVPGAATVLVYAAGRDVAVDRPSAFAAVVGDFLERGMGFARSATSTVLNP